jgi:GLPGLI family protein
MKKGLLLLFVFFIMFFDSYSQIKSGEVIYSVMKNPSSFFQSNPEMPKKAEETIRKIDAIIPSLKFHLKFNSSNSIFNMEQQLSIDNSEYFTKMAILFTQGNKSFFCDNKDRLILELTSFLDKDFIISSSMDDLKWTLTKEKKTIGGYVCYKAMTIIEMDIPNGKKEFNYIAWYCPELSFNYGPFNIVGLPGLVLEYSNDKLTYSAIKVNLSKKLLNIKAPDKGKYISKEEFNAIGKKMFEEINH